MPERAFRLEGLDEVTHTPVRIELRLVTEALGSSACATELFAAPRGFLPPEQIARLGTASRPMACQPRVDLRLNLAPGMAPRGFAPTAA